jgi:hypothetical protein
MYGRTARLFLLLLLAVDWGAEPEHLAPAVRMLARRLSSTECICPSLAYRREAVRKACPADAPERHVRRLPPRGTFPTRPDRSAPGVLRPARAGGLVYLLLSIRC